MIALALSAALLAPAPAPAGLSLACRVVDRSQRRSSFTLRLAGEQAHRRIAIEAGEGLAVIGALAGATLEDSKSRTAGVSTERWRLDSANGSFVLTASIDVRDPDALAQIDIVEYRHGAPGLNRTIATGRCRGGAPGTGASLAKLPPARTLPVEPFTPSVVSVGPTTLPLQCRLVGANLAPFGFDLNLTLDRDASEATFVTSHAEGQPWAAGDLRFKGAMVAARAVPPSNPEEAVVTAFIVADNEGVAAVPIKVSYRVEAWTGMIAGWIEISLKDNKPAGSGYCEPRGLTAAEREQQK